MLRFIDVRKSFGPTTTISMTWPCEPDSGAVEVVGVAGRSRWSR